MRRDQLGDPGGRGAGVAAPCGCVLVDVVHAGVLSCAPWGWWGRWVSRCSRWRPAPASWAQVIVVDVVKLGDGHTPPAVGCRDRRESECDEEGGWAVRPKRSGERVRSIRRAQAGEADTKRPNCAIRNPVKCQFLGRRAIRRPPVSVPRSEPSGPGVGRADLIADLVRAAEERLVSLGESGLGESRPHPKRAGLGSGTNPPAFLGGKCWTKPETISSCTPIRRR